MEDMNFEEMRNQIAILKTKLDKQEIVNDRIMHQVVTTKAGNMKRLMIISIICGLFVICMSPVVFYGMCRASWVFVLGTDVLMLYFMTREFLFKRSISDKNLMNASLLEVAKRMRDFKVSYKRYTLINIPLGFAWIIWFIVEVFSGGLDQMYYMIAGIIVGGIVGFGIGLKMYFRIQNVASDIIRQIEE